MGTFKQSTRHMQNQAVQFLQTGQPTNPWEVLVEQLFDVAGSAKPGATW